MKKAEIENYKKWFTPGCSHYIHRPKNALFISASNSYDHERAKFDIAYAIKKKGQSFISEACSVENPARRADIVNLSTGEIIEIEFSGKFKDDADRSFKVISRKDYEKLKSKSP